MENKMTWSNFYSHPRFWRHIKVWAAAFVFLGITLSISYYAAPKGEDFDPELKRLFIFVIEFVAFIYSGFYVFNKLWHKKEYTKLLVVLLLLVLLFSFIGHLTSTKGVQIGVIKGFYANVIVYPFFLIIAFGFKLAYHGAKQLFVIQRLEAKQTESELKLLKSQINPHFLFNTLNNIYATNLENAEKANDIILELADLLRYQLESNKKQLTPLKNEINSLENYIALEKIRVLDCKVAVEKKGNFEGVEIIPLLLLPFVENAFKYGTGIEAGDIDLRFEMKEDHQFSFYCKNKIVQKKGKVHSGGIGLENVKKRLDLMYKGRFTLDLKEEASWYIVDLKVKL